MPEGFFSGLEEGQEHQQAMQLGSLKAEMAQVGVEQQRVELARSNILLQGQQRMMEAMSKMNQQLGGPGAQLSDQTTRIADQLDAYGDMYMASGMPEQGSQLHERASIIRKNNATMMNAEDKRQTEDMQLVSNLMGNVHDQKSFQEAATVFMMERPNSVGAYNGLIQKIASGEVRYSPQIKQALADAATKNIDKVRERAEEARVKEEQATTVEKQHNTQYIDERLQHEKDLDDKLKREGDVQNKPVSAGLIARVVDRASEDYNVTDNPPDARRRALSVAERARDLMVNKPGQPGLSEAEAVNRAYQEKRRDFMGLQKRPTKEQPGGSRDRPMPLPEPGGKIEPGKWYEDDQGNVKQAPKSE